MYLRVTDDTPANLSYPYVNGQLEPGDTFGVEDEKGEALLDTHDYLKQVVDLDEDEYEDVSDGEAAEDLEDKTYEELRDLASEAEIDGRSDMDKAELVDALGEK